MNTCHKCGTTSALVSDDLCYACKTGRAWEQHHPFGRVIPITIPVPSNQHRILTDRQKEWPDAVRAPQTPLDWLALICYGTSDMLAWIAELIERLGGYLVAVGRQMTAAYGEQWTHELAPVMRGGDA